MSAGERAPTRLAFLDTETTGLDPDRAEVWEVAIIEAEHHPGRLVVTSQWCRQLRTEHLETADPYALQVGGFHDRRAASRERLTPARAAREVERRTRGRMMVGAVPSFDAGFLAPLLRAHHLPPTWHYQLIDVETLCAGYLAGRPAEQVMLQRPPGAGFAGGTKGPYVNPHALAQPPWRSDDLTAAVGAVCAEGQRHSALGDARWALDTYAAVYGLAREGLADAPDLTEAQPPNPSHSATGGT